MQFGGTSLPWECNLEARQVLTVPADWDNADRQPETGATRPLSLRLKTDCWPGVGPVSQLCPCRPTQESGDASCNMACVLITSAAQPWDRLYASPWSRDIEHRDGARVPWARLILQMISVAAPAPRSTILVLCICDEMIPWLPSANADWATRGGRRVVAEWEVFRSPKLYGRR